MKPHPLISSMVNKIIVGAGRGGGGQKRHPLHNFHGPGKIDTCQIGVGSRVDRLSPLER